MEVIPHDYRVPAVLEADSSDENILEKKSFHLLPKNVSLSGALFPIIKIQ